MILTLTLIELKKVFCKWRTYIGFAAIGVLVPFVQTVLYFEGEHVVNSFTGRFADSFFFTGNLLNGYLIGYIVLQALFIHIPFLIVLVGSDLLAGEATAGTYRILMTRPVSRFNISLSKFIAGLFYTLVLLLWLMFVSLGVSLLIFGKGELIVVWEKVYIFAADDVLWRFIAAYVYAFLSMSMVLTLSYLFSSMVENAIGPIVASMAVIIIFIVVSSLPIEVMESIKPYLFTSYMDKWRDFFRDPIDWSIIIESGLVLLAHILGLFLITTYILKKKDILS